DGVERLAGRGTGPVVGHADHAVERDRTIEASGGRCLEHLHAAHAEPEDRDLAHVVVHDQVVGRGFEVADLELVVELRHVRRAVASVSPRTSTGARANGSGARTAKPWVARRRHRSSNSGRTPMMSVCTTRPVTGMPSGRAWMASTAAPSGPFSVMCSTSTSCA